MIELDKILQKADDLPVLPNIAMELLSLIEQKNSVPEDFQKIIENDQVLTLKILKMANSAYYGFPRKIMDIKEAIVILGYDTLKSLVLSLITRHILSNTLKSYGLKKGELWEHSVVVAMIARYMAKSIKVQNSEKFFVAGLLHDIGKLLLDFYLVDDKESILYQVNEGNLEFSEIEQRVIGYDHAFVGGKLIEKWNLPEFLYTVIMYHHNYDNAPPTYRKEAFIIYLADRLSYRIARGAGTEYMVNKIITPKEYGMIGLNNAEIEILIKNIKRSIEEINLS